MVEDFSKERILNVSLDNDEINKRYDMIEYFQQKNNNETFYNLCKCPLKKIIDIEKRHGKMGLNILNPYDLTVT